MSKVQKILLIEDDQFITDLYNTQLQSMGYDLDIAPDGTQGIQKLNEKEYDLLLLDIMLPGINGLAVLKEWRTNHPNSTMPVIMLTNVGQDDIIKQAYELGATGYFVKSAYSLEQIASQIKQILESKTT